MEPPKLRLSVSYSGPDHDSRFSGEYTQHGMENNRLTFKRDSDSSPDETFLLFKVERNTYPVPNLHGACFTHAPRWAFVRPNAVSSSAVVTADLAVNVNSKVDKELAKLYYT